MAKTLRDIDNSWDYEVYDAYNNFNDGSNNDTNDIARVGSATFNGKQGPHSISFNSNNSLDELLPDFDDAETMSQLEEEYSTSCDRCGAFIGWNKWDKDEYSARMPGLCLNCSFALNEEVEDTPF